MLIMGRTLRANKCNVRVGFSFRPILIQSDLIFLPSTMIFLHPGLFVYELPKLLLAQYSFHGIAVVRSDSFCLNGALQIRYALLLIVLCRFMKVSK